MPIELREGRFEYDTETNKLAPTPAELYHWFLWANEHRQEFEKKYEGKHLAIWDRQIIGIGGDLLEASEQAEHCRPDVEPYFVYVPTEKETYLLV